MQQHQPGACASDRIDDQSRYLWLGDTRFWCHRSRLVPSTGLQLDSKVTGMEFGC